VMLAEKYCKEGKKVFFWWGGFLLTGGGKKKKEKRSVFFSFGGGGGARCWWRSWLRHCATSQKVAGSIPDAVIGIIH